MSHFKWLYFAILLLENNHYNELAALYVGTEMAQGDFESRRQ